MLGVGSSLKQTPEEEEEEKIAPVIVAVVGGGGGVSDMEEIWFWILWKEVQIKFFSYVFYSTLPYSALFSSSHSLDLYSIPTYL